MFLDIVSEKKVKIKCVKDVVTFLTANNEIGSLLPEYIKLIKILFTVPISSCTNESTFSALRHLKTYLRFTMGQRRLNNVSTLHIHQDVLYKVDLNKVLNDFISRNYVRRKTFSLK